MRHELSTPLTWVYRWLIPGALTVVAGGALWVLVIGPEGPPDTTSLLSALAIAAGSMILARIFDRAKRVWIAGDQLVFAAYGKEYSTALDAVETVSQTPFFRPHRIRLTFSTNTAFGNSILFFPPLSARHLFGEHPVVAELQQRLAAQ